MHHSSIRDHLSKCHPEKSHNSCEPGYIFNSAAVPEPESSHFEPNATNLDILEQINKNKNAQSLKKPLNNKAKQPSKSSIDADDIQEDLNMDKEKLLRLNFNLKRTANKKSPKSKFKKKILINNKKSSMNNSYESNMELIQKLKGTDSFNNYDDNINDDELNDAKDDENDENEDDENNDEDNDDSNINFNEDDEDEKSSACYNMSSEQNSFSDLNDLSYQNENGSINRRVSYPVISETSHLTSDLNSNRRISYPTIPSHHNSNNLLLPSLGGGNEFNSFLNSNKNNFRTSSALSPSSSSMSSTSALHTVQGSSPNSSTMASLANLPFNSSSISNILQQNSSQHNELISSLFPNLSGSSSSVSSQSACSSSPNSSNVSHFNSIASALIQRLSAAAFFQQYANNSNANILNNNTPDSSMTECLKIDTNSPHKQNSKGHKTGLANSDALDLSVKSEPNKKKTKLESIDCSDEYASSSLSPASTSSTISSSASIAKVSKMLNSNNKTENSSSNVSDTNQPYELKTFKTKNQIKEEQKANTSASTSSSSSSPTTVQSRKSNNKAISDVINRLNLNLPNSNDDSKNLMNFSSKKICMNNSDSFNGVRKASKSKYENLLKINTEKLDETEEDEYQEYMIDDAKLDDQTSDLNSNLTNSNESAVSSTSPSLNSGSKLESNNSTNNNEQDNGQQNSLNAGFKCTYCNIIFNEYPLYSIHAGMHSNRNPWQCSVCNHVCSNKIDFSFHILHLSKN